MFYIVGICNVLYCTSAHPEATPPIGKIRGSASTSRLGKKIYSFRGVRYAEPPTERRRFQVNFSHFFSPLDYNSINSGKIPGAWIFVKLIVNLQLCRNKGNLPCFLFTNEYLSGGTFTRVGIILAIFPPDCNTSGRLERCFRRFERGSRISKFWSNGVSNPRIVCVWTCILEKYFFFLI